MSNGGLRGITVPVQTDKGVDQSRVAKRPGISRSETVQPVLALTNSDDDERQAAAWNSHLWILSLLTLGTVLVTLDAADIRFPGVGRW